MEKATSSRIKTILPNEWGHYEDPDTNIVFDPRTRRAFGVQDEDGIVSHLGSGEIKTCEKYGWEYDLPPEESDEEEDEESS